MKTVPALGAAAMLLLSACSSSSPTARSLPQAALACGGIATADGVLIKANESSCLWPFDAGQVEVICKKNNDVYVRVDNQVYALNGMAMARGGLDLRPIWLPDPNKVMADAGLKISISEFIDVGLALCE